jgi:predicted GNAT superfamily acetyltransferase
MQQARITIRQASDADFDAILALNVAEVQHTSAMDLDRLIYLDSISCYHKVACIDGMVVAFLFAMNKDAPYENDNFSWFFKLYGSFIYVDRIVVSSDHGGMKLGSLLYQDLFAHARANAVSTITCEYNILPPNLASARFHDKFGFKEIGTQWVANKSKKVSLQAVDL